MTAENIGNFIGYIATLAIFTAIFWGFGAFVSWAPNPADWSALVRVLTGAGFLIIWSKATHHLING